MAARVRQAGTKQEPKKKAPAARKTCVFPYLQYFFDQTFIRFEQRRLSDAHHNADWIEST
jgi:hypothetical protein